MQEIAANDVAPQAVATGVTPAFDLIGLTNLRDDPRFAGIDGSGVSVAVIDTGLDRTHPLLAPNYVAGRDFVFSSNDPVDRIGHGTHVAGTVGATDPAIGVAPDVDLIGLQVFQPSGGAATTTIEDALEWVLANQQTYNIVAVNMSLGSGFFSSEAQARSSILFDDIQRLEQAGITVVSAGGNSYRGNEFPNFSAPAVLSTVAVGAVWEDGSEPSARWGSGATDFSTGADRIVSFSQRLDAPNTLFAPGALIRSTVPGGGLEDKAGTSMAAPMVAGVVALMQEAAQQFGGRQLQPDEVVDILRSTADPIFDGDDEDDNVVNTNTGYLRVDAHAAVEAVWERFGGGGGDGGGPGPDTNGTLNTAVPGPRVDGSADAVRQGTIGFDGSANNVGGIDVDLYRFELLSPGTLTLSTEAADSGAATDTILRLFDANGTQIAIADDIDPIGNRFSRIDLALEPGTYFAGVSGFPNGGYDPNVAGSGTEAEGLGDYALRWSLASLDPNGVIAGAVPVNIDGDEPAQQLGLIGSDFGTAVGNADVDLFEIVAPDGGFLVIDIDTPFNDGFVDSFLRVFDSQGRQIASSNDNLAFDETGRFVEFTDPRFPGLVFEDPIDRSVFFGHTQDSFLSVPVQRGETYYVGISDVFNSTYDLNDLNGRSNLGTGGTYTLFVDFVNSDVNGSIPQAATGAILPLENAPGLIGFDGDPETGQTLPVGDRDVDFIRLRPDQDGVLEVDIDAQNRPELFDPVDAVLLVFDENGTLLARNDDSDGFDPLVQLPVRAATDYFVAVTGFGNDDFDPFQLASGSPGDTGEYRISARLRPEADAVVLSDGTISSGNLAAVDIGSVVFGEIGVDGSLETGTDDIDLYRFAPTVTTAVDIAVFTNEEFSADTVLRVFDAAGNEIAFNDDAGPNTRGSAVTIDVTAGQELFIGINGASPQARDYDPITGAGAAPGIPGVYTLVLSAGADPDQDVVYRFFNPSTGAHFYTANPAERDLVIETLPQFDFEGPSFGVAAPDTPDSDPVFRFFNTETGVHFYTISEAERDSVDATLPQFAFEGEAYRAYEEPVDGSIPLFRFFNGSTGTHFYTPAEAERDTVLATLPQFDFEGIAYYVDPLG